MSAAIDPAPMLLRAQRRHRSTRVVGALAALLALWLGLTARAVSPVAPSVPVQQVVPAAVNQAVAPPVVVDPGPGLGGDGRR
jgi:hypothetical protein